MQRAQYGERWAACKAHLLRAPYTCRCPLSVVRCPRGQRRDGEDRSPHGRLFSSSSASPLRPFLPPAALIPLRALPLSLPLSFSLYPRPRNKTKTKYTTHYILLPSRFLLLYLPSLLALSMAPSRPAAKPSPKPRVIIVGAGIGGVTLAILLERAGIPYNVYERAAEIKPLGSALTLGPNVAPFLKQIGIYDEIVSKAKKRTSIDVFNENRELSFVMDFAPSSPLDPNKFPELKDEVCHYSNIVADDRPYSIHPAGSRGAIGAIQDAICLANWINVIPSTSLEDMEKMFKEYQSERLPSVKADFAFGQRMAHVSARNFKAKIVRYMAKNMPDWLWTFSHTKNVANRPQVAFLPLVQDEGTVKPQYQPSLHKTLQIIRARDASRMVVNNYDLEIENDAVTTKSVVV
ncbi:hypothetical protein KVV02_001758 [Mortierella alpina]|uniref:FAD-binding domain-containing protein n=1 Tax=Mortierella alpina TaxID=64518 RepID=A0A9P7ZWE2_MORAP|nr:hypothetical protein KVV02_001758 [Mortierella alpina]